MTQEEINKYNAVIAVFTGTKAGYDENDVWQPLKFHSDWNELMKAVHKISEIVDKADVHLTAKILHYCRNNNNIFDCRINADMELVYAAVCDFIQWYNEQEGGGLSEQDVQILKAYSYSDCPLSGFNDAGKNLHKLGYIDSDYELTELGMKKMKEILKNEQEAQK